MKKRVLSLVLAIAMVISMLPSMTLFTSAQAAAEKPENYWYFGTESHGYQAETQSYNTTTKLTNFQLEETVASVSDPWEFVNIHSATQYSAYPGYYRWGQNKTTNQVAPTPEEPTALILELTADTAGTFTPSLTYIAERSGEIYNVYMIKKPSNASAWHCETPVSGVANGNLGQRAARNLAIAQCVEANLVGQVDTYGTGEIKTASFDKKTIEAGSYYLILRPVGANPNWILDKTSVGSRYLGTIALVSFALGSNATPTNEPIEYDISLGGLHDDAIANYDGLLSVNGTIDNKELMYVSWKEKVSGKAPAVDLTKSAGFELYGRSTNDSSPIITADGFMSSLYTSAAGADAGTLNAAGAATRNIYAIRINVPYGGRFKLSTLINFTADNATLKALDTLGGKENGDGNGVYDTGAVAKVYLAHAAFDLTHREASGTVTNAKIFDDLIKTATEVGYHNANNLAADADTPAVNEVGYVDIPRRGEYYVIFDMDSDAFAKHSKCWYRNNRYWQEFLLSGIRLTPVTDNTATPVMLDLSRYNMKYLDKTVPNAAITGSLDVGGYDIVLDKTTDYVARVVTCTMENGLAYLFPQLQIRSNAWATWPIAANYDKYKTMFTVKKNFAAGGYYSIDMLGFKHYGGSDFAVYVNGEYVGDYNCWSGTTEKDEFALNEKKQLNTVYIPAGDAEISFRSRVAYYGTPNLYPAAVWFTPVDIDELKMEKIETDIASKLIINEENTITAQIKMNDGSYLGMGLNNSAAVDTTKTVSVAVEDESIAEVTNVLYAQPEVEKDITFTVTGKAVGTTNIKITANINGKEYTETVPVRIIPVPALETVEVGFEKSELPATRTTNTTLKLISNNDGAEWTKESTAVYESGNTAVATVDAATGVVTGVSEGEAEIIAHVTSEGKTVTGKATITILPEPKLASIAAEIDSTMLLIGDTTKISVSGTMDDGIEADMTGSTYKYISTNEDIATVDAGGNVSTHAAGDAVITIMATTPKGEIATTTTTITVYETAPSLTVDFSKSTYNSDRSAPTITPGYTIVREETDTTMWRLGMAQNTGFSAAYMWLRGGMWPATSTITNNALTILVDIPYEYDYNIKVHGAVWHQTGIFSVFVDGVYAGDYNCYNPNITTMTDLGPVSLNTLHLTKGEHKISFRSREKHYSSAAVISIGTITFDPVAESGTSLVGINDTIPTELAIGEVYNASAYAEMSDGSALHYGINNDGSADSGKIISVSSDNDAALGISGFVNYILGATGKIPFTLTGVSAGTANVTLDADIDGAKSTKTVTVTVKDDPLDSVSATTEAKEVFLGDKTMLVAKTLLASGREIDRANAPVTYTTEDTDIITIEGDMLTTVAVGKTTVKASATFNGKTVEDSFEVEVLPEGMTAVEATSGGSPRIRLTDNEEDKYPLSIVAISNLGNKIDLSDAEVTAVSLTPEFAEINAEVYPLNGGEFGNYIKPISEGTAIFEVTVKVDGRIRTKTVELPVVKAKTSASYMTDEKAEIAKENARKYDWAKSTVDSIIKEADKYVGKEDVLYDMIASNEVPRGFGVGAESEPEMYYCRYCGENLQAKYGTQPWKHNPFTRPWKIQCPDCKRYFPSNNFESFYELGLNEYGEFERMLALERHREIFGDKTVETPGAEGSESWKKYYGYGVPGGYLTNELYSNIENEESINVYKGLREGETTETWGVDDGMGYVPRKADGTPYVYETTGLAERHTYIAEYMHYGIYSKVAGDNGGVMYEAVRTCSMAYFYTGEKKYGRTAAILLDRIADFYPGFDISVFGKNVWNSHGGSRVGKRLGRIWETSHARNDVQAYDIVFDMYDDPYVLNFIQDKAKNWKMRYSKQTPSQIRQNIEDGLVRETLEGIRNNQINGNFGMAQSTNAIAAIVLDSMPETKEWLDYLMAPGWQASRAPVAGGGLNEIYIDRVDSDGQSDEASDYGLLWLSYSGTINNILSGYDKYPAANLKNNPKYVQMYYALLPMYAAPSYSAQIGDGGATASNTHWITTGYATNGWKETNDPVFAQMIYMLNGNSSDGLHYTITDKDPERLEKEVQAVIDEYGTVELDSDIQMGFGYAILRDGKSISNVTTSTATETTRNAWMYFGSNGGHGHRDTLNLGMTAFGLNILPDLGYPEATGNTPHRLQWTSTTLSHNTVVVNEKQQTTNTEVRGKALHYEDADMVQVIDVDANYVYEDTEQYRRSVVMVNIDDANSYYVDIFRVLGGNSHLYSLHATSNEIAETVGLDGKTPQVDENGEYVGSFAGEDVPYGNDPNSPNQSNYETVYPRGYTWLKNVDRYASSDDKFEVDFAIKDFNKAIKDSKDIHLRVTMLNGSNVENGATTKVSIADGLPPQKAENKNVDKLKYLLIENTGENLDTVFTTVFEPYKNNRTISSVEELEPTVEGKENAGDAHRVVKVTLANGRVDYVFYSTNKNVTYTIVDGENTIAFRGFVGVYSLKNNKNVYKYVLDGDIIGEATDTKSAIEGTVLNFTKELAFENTIEILPTASVTDEELEALTGKIVTIDNGALSRDGAWKILSADRSGDNILLNVGRVTTIRSYVDASDTSKGYNYIIAAGQKATIPLSSYEDKKPEIEDVGEHTTSAGSTITINLKATSPDNETVKYYGTTLPRGASVDENTGVLTWKPTSSQTGDNHFAITARDESGREETIHFIVTVYGSTTGGSSGAGSTAGGGGSGSDSAGSAGGSGGAATTPDDTTEPDSGDDKTTTPDEGDAGSAGAGDTENIRFIDLGAHAWAADSINALADDGIVKGTTANTYSPAKNITRADFALLLVRAFKLTSDNTDNFSDVLDSDYFASELAIARNTGIVNGIGDNKYAPRNTITRQDMMTIVYRALTTLEKELTTGDIDYPDFDKVATYAQDAVKALITSGLVNGKNGYIDPTANTTRAEVAVLLKRILDYTK